VQAFPELELLRDRLVGLEAGRLKAGHPPAVAVGAAAAAGQGLDLPVDRGERARRRALHVDDREEQHGEQREHRQPETGAGELQGAPPDRTADPYPTAYAMWITSSRIISAATQRWRDSQ